jgi:hypothetical protein
VKRVIVVAALLCSVVGISAASAQTYIPHFTEERVEVDESNGAVVVTLRMHGPGRVQYQTMDGWCEQGLTSPLPTCWAPYARAPGDYGAVSGEVLFTEAGTRQITIPIVDDGEDEDLESFTVWATAGPDRGWANASIIDDDGAQDNAGDPGPATMSTTTIRRPAPGSSPIAVPPVDEAVVTTSPSPRLEVKIASGELQPGPGFELMSDEGAQPAPDRQNENGRGASPVALGVSAAAAATGGVAMSVQRRRRWSPTRS